jgi:hypothetical protein
MAAATGVSSESASEPAAPQAAATDPVALKPSVPEPAAPAAVEDTAAVPDLGQEPAAPEPDEPGGRTRGVGRLVAAAVVIVVIAAAAAAGVLVVVTHGFRPKTIVTYRTAAVFKLRAGDCVNSSPNGLSVTILSCATPHQAEVFATFRLTGSSWPGSTTVQQQANSGCSDRIASYLNPQLLNAGLTQEYVYPNHDAWQAGVRTVVCEVSSSTGPLSGSVRQSG